MIFLTACFITTRRPLKPEAVHRGVGPQILGYVVSNVPATQVLFGGDDPLEETEDGDEDDDALHHGRGGIFHV